MAYTCDFISIQRIITEQVKCKECKKEKTDQRDLKVVFG